MKVALVHDYLVNRGGAERVVAAMHRMWPDAPIYTSLYHPEQTYPDFADARVITSFLQRWSRDAARFRRFLPLFPAAFARMQIAPCDVVLSSSAGFAHGVHPPAGACHIVYCYSPPRFLWDERYGFEGVTPRWAKPFLPVVLAGLRRWDVRAARRAHHTLAVSRVAAARIRRIYGVESTVLYPPVNVERFTPIGGSDDHWLFVGRLLPHRRADVAVRAFAASGRRLVVVGDGPARDDLRAIAGSGVEFRGVVTDDELRALYARCRGVVVPGEEDLGLIPLEANAAGKPAVALGREGALETVRDGVTGILFDEQTPDALNAAIARAEATPFDTATLRAHAETFSEQAFAANLRGFVESARATCERCARGRP